MDARMAYLVAVCALLVGSRGVAQSVDVRAQGMRALAPLDQFDGERFAPLIVQVQGPADRAVSVAVECTVGGQRLSGRGPARGSAWVRVAALETSGLAAGPLGLQPVTCIARAVEAGVTDPDPSNDTVTGSLVLEAPTIPDLRVHPRSSPQVHECDTDAPPVVGRPTCVTIHWQYEGTQQGAHGPGVRATCTLDGRPIAAAITSGALQARLERVAAGPHELDCALHPHHASFDRDPSNNEVSVRFEVAAVRRYDLALIGIAASTVPATHWIHGCHSAHPMPATGIDVSVANLGTHAVTARVECSDGTTTLHGNSEAEVPPGETAAVRVTTGRGAMPRGARSVQCSVQIARPGGAPDHDPSNDRRAARVTNALAP